MVQRHNTFGLGLPTLRQIVSHIARSTYQNQTKFVFSIHLTVSLLSTLVETLSHCLIKPLEAKSGPYVKRH